MFGWKRLRNGCAGAEVREASADARGSLEFRRWLLASGGLRASDPGQGSPNPGRARASVASGRDTPDQPLRDVSTCVVLARGDDLPPGLLASLERRGVETLVIGHPSLAFSELLRLAHEAPVPGASPPALALVIANRDRWPEIESLLTALRRHLPGVGLWIGAHDLFVEVNRSRPDVPPLRLTGHELESTLPRTVVPPATVEPVGPVDPAEPAPSADDDLEPDAPDSRSRPPMDTAVTPDEIEMLLRLFEDESDENGSPGPPESGR